MKARAEIIKEVRSIILQALGVRSIAAVKRKMREAATAQHGTVYGTIDTGRGVTLTYTDNSNCFASYIVNLRGVGMVSQYAIDKASITAAGRARGCSSFYLFE